MADLEQTIEIEVNLIVEAYCTICNTELTIDDVDSNDTPQYPHMIQVSICPECEKKEYNRGYEDGLKDAIS